MTFVRGRKSRVAERDRAAARHRRLQRDAWTRCTMRHRTGLTRSVRRTRVTYGLERDGATLHAVLTTVPSRTEVWVDRLPQSGPMRGSHGLPPSLLGPIRTGVVGGKTVPSTYRLTQNVRHASDEREMLWRIEPRAARSPQRP